MDNYKSHMKPALKKGTKKKEKIKICDFNLLLQLYQ